jgi:tRNA threonylcarbamoyladenosine biosynthesis protein TsaB
MLILAIDTSTRAGSAAVLRDAEVLAEVSGLEETPYSTRLFRDVAALRSKAQFSLDHVDLFAVAAGPGSFTGLRVGLTAVKAWAEVHRKPIAAISGLEAIASQFLHMSATNFSKGYIAPFLDARRGYVFGAVYRKAIQETGLLELISEEAILPVQEFLEMVRGSGSSKQQAALVSPTPAAVPIEEARIILPSSRIEQVPAALAASVGRLGYERAQRGALVDPVQLDANYVRRSDAEAATKER